jgi:hypothetical protein
MKKFLVLYLSSIPAADQMAESTREQADAGTARWMAWAKRAGNSLVDLGSPVGEALKVDKGGTRSSDTKVAGFSILQAESAQKLTELLVDHPHHRSPGASIDVLEFVPMHAK